MSNSTRATSLAYTPTMLLNTANLIKLKARASPQNCLKQIQTKLSNLDGIRKHGQSV